jgi:hypothetical protein
MSREVTGDAPRTGAAVTDLEADLDDPADASAAPGGPDAAPPRLRRAHLLLAALAAVAGLAVAGTVVGGLPERRAAPTPAPTSPAPSGQPEPQEPLLAAQKAASDLPLDLGLWARVTADGRESGDWTHVKAKVSITNMGGAPRRIGAVSVVGLGVATVEAPGTDLAPQASVDLAASVEVDCESLATPGVPVVVVITEYDRAGRDIDVRANAFEADPDPRAVLAPLCPAVEPGLRVAVAASGGGADGVTMRLVNHGNLSGLVTPRHAPDAGDLRLVSDPPLPYDLGPGQAVVATLRVAAAAGTDGCPDAGPAAAAEALYLEAETPYGFTAVTGFPTAAVEAAVRAWIARTDCR